ncbi:ycaC protein [Dacryopinax primogenitus]|uniref:YcaC protein n=1 Tax=Dacryopinax primogenitus (strain DJM 731) TaxID=1858805 RepID=M5G487_DACPD|nr:ycaC protein [Dacryopinax primogenitus]EJU05076.1 ycaC protein [Dacryopinax primogenitus]
MLHLLSFAVALLAFFAGDSGFTYNRLDKDTAALLLVDHQSGLFQLVHDIERIQFRNNVFALSKLGNLFNLTTILSSSAQTGLNGPLPRQILEDHPNATFIQRPGQVNAWDNKDFRNAVQATKKTQLIVAGITTDVCVAFLALSLAQEGYDVFVVRDASGTFDTMTAELAYDRMRQAPNIQVLSLFAVTFELLRDWRTYPGAAYWTQFFTQYWTEIDMLSRSHDFAANITSS